MKREFVGDVTCVRVPFGWNASCPLSAETRTETSGPLGPDGPGVLAGDKSVMTLRDVNGAVLLSVTLIAPGSHGPEPLEIYVPGAGVVWDRSGNYGTRVVIG